MKPENKQAASCVCTRLCHVLINRKMRKSRRPLTARLCLLMESPDSYASWIGQVNKTSVFFGFVRKHRRNDSRY